MGLYDLHEAQLEHVTGEGYCYSTTTVFGKKYEGVFFGEGIEQLKDLEEVTFSGVVYEKKRRKKKTFSVEITKVIATPAGERADIVATEQV